MMQKYFLKSLFDGKPETRESLEHDVLPHPQDAENERLKNYYFGEIKRHAQRARDFDSRHGTVSDAALEHERGRIYQDHHNAKVGYYHHGGDPDDIDPNDRSVIYKTKIPSLFGILSKGTGAGFYFGKALAGNNTKPGYTLDANTNRQRKLAPGETPVAQAPKTPPAALHSAMARHGAMFTGYDQHGNAAYWHPEPGKIAAAAKSFLNENYGAGLAHQRKSKLLSGESATNVEHTLHFRHSKNDPVHGVKITNVGFNNAEKMPSAPNRQRSFTPQQVEQNQGGGKPSPGTRNQWKTAAKDAYGKMEEHAHNAAYALQHYNAKDFAHHAAEYMRGNPHLMQNLQNNVIYNWGRRAAKHIGNIQNNLAQQAKPKKEFFSLAKSLFDGKPETKESMKHDTYIPPAEKKKVQSHPGVMAFETGPDWARFVRDGTGSPAVEPTHEMSEDEHRNFKRVFYSVDPKTNTPEHNLAWMRPHSASWLHRYEVSGLGRAKGKHPDLERTYPFSKVHEAYAAAHEIARRSSPYLTKSTFAPSMFEKAKKSNPDYDKETAAINKNKKKPEANKPHDFKRAKWTFPNGHPRCLICGDEEPIGGKCNMPDEWYKKHDDPMPLQKANASGYKLHKRLKWQGMDVSVENRKGSFRMDKQHTPPEWKTKMLCDYGYLRGTDGVDGDHVDVFVGPDENAKFVYVINQNDPKTGKFDEQKCMLNFTDAAAAKKMYLKHYDSPKFFGSIKAFPVEEFKAKVLSKDSRMVKSMAERMFSDS